MSEDNIVQEKSINAKINWFILAFKIYKFKFLIYDVEK